MLILVDDNESVLLSLEHILDELGYRTRGFTSAEAALAFLREHREPIRMVVSDQRLPGMSGLDFLQQAGRLQTEARRMLISGHPPDKIPADVAFLQKPFRLEHFERAVGSLLDGGPGAPADRTCAADS